VTSKNSIYNNTINLNSQNGIYLSYSSSSTIINNTVYSNGYSGISCSNSKNNSILRNTLYSNKNHGIYFTSSTSNQIRLNNLYMNTKHGICLASGSTKNMISNNSVNSNNMNGILLSSANSNKILNNTINSNTEYGLNLKSSNSNMIDINNISKNNKRGVFLESSKSNIIKNNYCKLNWDYGMVLYLSNSNTIRNNYVASTKFYDGIRLDSSDSNILKENNCTNNWAGIKLVSDSDSNRLEDNLCNKNKGSGIDLDSSPSNIIIENDCNRNFYDGISISSSRTNTIKENICNSNDMTGIDLYSSDSNIVLSNNCSENNYGIIISSSDFNTITINNLNNSTKVGIYCYQSQSNRIDWNFCNYIQTENGITLEDSDSNSIENNTCQSNIEYGISLNNSKSNTVEFNILNCNVIGSIRISNSSLNKFWHNNCSNNVFGVEVKNSDNNIFYCNDLALNSDTGISITATCNNNDIYYNNLLFNSQQAIDLGINNWDNGVGEGNYWSDYNGVDDGSGTGKHAITGDGIGDTQIPHLGLDNYPFVNRSGWWVPEIPILHDPGVHDTDGWYTISWNETNRATGYILEEATEPLFESPNVIFDGADLSFEVTARNEGTYYYRTKSNKGNRESIWSKTVDIIVDYPPITPTNLRVSVYPPGNAINLSWDMNFEDTVLYELYYKTNSISTWQHLANITHPGNDFNHSCLIDGELYYYQIRAKDARGQLSGFSLSKNGKPADSIPPERPTGLIVIFTEINTITLTWVTNTEVDLEGYYIYRSLTPEPLVWDDLITMVNKDTVKYIDDGLDEITTYYYVITAIDEVPNESDYSEIIFGTTLLGQYPPEVNKTVDKLEIPEDTYDDQSINLYHLFKDVNADPLIFSCSGHEHIKVTIYQNNGTVVLVPELNWNGEETLTFSASDGISNKKATMTITIIITPVNDPPGAVDVITPIMNIKISDGDKLDFRASCIDPDIIYGDELTYSWSTDISGTIGAGESLTNILLTIGKHQITVEVSDRSGEISFNILYVTVLETNESDSDGDGLPNVWERDHGLDPDDKTDANIDFDKDGLSNQKEFVIGTDPQKLDTDNDGLSDSEEINHLKTDPLRLDTDSDGYNDGLDEFPLDESRWKKEDEKPTDDEKPTEKDNDNSGLYLILGIIVVIIIILMIFLFVLKPRMGKKIKEEETKQVKPEPKTTTKTPKSLYPKTLQITHSPKQPQQIPTILGLIPETSCLATQPETQPEIIDIKDLLKQGSLAYSQGRYTDAILAWQQVLEKEPNKHPDIEMAIKDAMGKIK
jgi:parallel beta-helix repeat protein